MPEIDIDVSANEVVALLQQHQARQAAARLEELRSDQAPVVQESLDRYVSVRGAAELAALRQPGGVQAVDSQVVQPMLRRLNEAARPPRMPSAEETRDLPQAQQFDVYASIVATRGEPAATDALANHERVILGLRHEDRTTVGRGQGDYNDRIVVLWNDQQGGRHAREFNTVTTDPTAQYDGHAKTNPRSQGFEDVVTRAKTEGADVNGDRIADMGRLAEGTTEMMPAQHPYRKATEWAMRPSAEAIAAGANRVERDSNGDGWFDARDTHGVQDLNDTFKIHRGSRLNTDSAGCQTIGGNEYDTFVQTVRGNPDQNRWQYVLSSVSPGHVQNIGDRQPVELHDDPRQPGHPDHGLQQQISTGLQAMGGQYAHRSDDYSLQMLYEAKAAGMTRVDQLVASNAVGGRAAGETLFMLQGRPGDPAALRVGVNAAAVTDTPVETSLQQLQQQSREHPARPPAPVQQAPQPDAPAIGGR